jgi:hypothetical protein
MEKELVRHDDYETQEEAMTSVFEYGKSFF